MRILITGMNKLQCTENFYLRQQLKVVPSHLSLIACLRDAGHEVEQRMVTIGESLDRYDRVIVFIHNAGGFINAVYNAGWALYQRPDALVAVDDWQVESICNSLLFTSEEEMTRPHLYNQHTDLAGLNPTNQRFILRGIQTVRDGSRRFLISAFRGGKPELMWKGMRDIVTYNPNPYHLHRKTVEVKPEEKDRRFNFASLVQGQTARWLKKQQIPWPVDYFGSKREAQDRVTEDVMVAVFAHQWGCLMPGYYHAGSGWWRSRPTQVADAGSILIGEPSEMRVYYGREDLAELRAGDLAELSVQELTTIAEAQRECLYRLHPLDRAQQQQELREALQ